MMNREKEKIPAEIALTKQEINILDRLVPDKTGRRKMYLQDYLLKIEKLGGYLSRASDPPPGNTVMWRGIKKLIEVQIGFEMSMEFVGN